MRQFLHSCLLDQRNRYYFLVSDVLAVVTIISILSIVLETVVSLASYSHWFLYIEWIAAGIFLLEYIARAYVTTPTRSYVCSAFGVIDLVSIVPTFLGLGNLTFLKSARSLRLIRLLRMMRLAKVGRNSRVGEESLGVLGFNVSIYFLTLVVALLGVGSLMYLVEPQHAAFASIPAGMWWALKVFMAGIPVAEPVTWGGEVLFVITRFVGLLLLGLLVGIVGNVFNKLLVGKH